MPKKGHHIAVPSDIVKDPYVLEFLGLEKHEKYLEKDIEQALIDKLQQFLLELGKGFSFVARQQRITLDGDHFYIDLVFYNRLTRCFVLIDLKVGKLTHQDIGQMHLCREKQSCCKVHFTGRTKADIYFQVYSLFADRRRIED